MWLICAYQDFFGTIIYNIIYMYYVYNIYIYISSMYHPILETHRRLTTLRLSLWIHRLCSAHEVLWADQPETWDVMNERKSKLFKNELVHENTTRNIQNWQTLSIDWRLRCKIWQDIRYGKIWQKKSLERFESMIVYGIWMYTYGSIWSSAEWSRAWLQLGSKYWDVSQTATQD